ncbi:piRNA biogenesis protein EXD1-like [Glandiceps talaboti]
MASSSATRFSEDMVGEAVAFFRIYLARKNPRQVADLFSILGQVPFTKCRREIKEHLGRSISLLRQFLSEQTKYFEVVGDNVSLRPTKTKEEIETLLQSAVSPFMASSTNTPSQYQGNIQIVQAPGECASIVNQILSKVSQCPVVAVDCEGENLGRGGKLSLVQLATCDGQVYLFDIVASGKKLKLFEEGKLAKLLESDQIVKVMHNCRSDSTTLYDELGITLRNVFDTECAYQILLEQHNIEKRQSSPSLNHICELFGGPTNPIKEDKVFKKKMIYTQGFWSRRPMSDKMIQYAAKDVRALVPTVYENMDRLISEEWRSRFKKVCQENVDCHFKKK